MNHGIHPEADREFTEAVQYYAGVSVELGREVYLELERVIREVCAQPERFMKFSPPARRALLHGFPYAVVYVEQPERVWILAVMHCARRPGYWRHRLN